MLPRSPGSVTSPGVADTSSSCSADTVTSSRCLPSWFGASPSTASNTSWQTATRSGCATQEPSNPSPASRSLSSRTLANARSFTSGSFRLGMNAAIPPIANAPRRWQVFTSSCAYARMNGAAIVTEFRSGSTKAAPESRKYLITLNR